MLILEKLTLNNFISHEKTEISFKENDKVLLDGKSGAGKSSIVEGITWCLYGKGRSDNNRGLIKNGKSSARVVLTMDDDGLKYRIERTVTRAGKNTLKVSSGKTLSSLKHIGVTGMKAIQSYLEKKILKSSYLLFINSISYPQDNSDNFVKQTASRRKDILLEIVNASVYDEYYEKTRVKLRESVEEYNVKKAEIEALKPADTELYKKIPKKKKQLREDIEKFTKELDSKKDIFKDLTDEVNKLEVKEAMLQIISSNMDSNESDIEKEKNNLSQLKTERNELADRDFDKEIEEIGDIEPKKKKLLEYREVEKAIYNWDRKTLELMNEKPGAREYDKEIEEVNRQMIGMLSKKIELCPELNKECPIIIKDRDTQVSELGERLKKIQSDKDDYLYLLDLYIEKRKKIGDRPVEPTKNVNELAESLKRDEDKITSVENDKKHALEMKDRIVKQLDGIKLKISELEKKNVELKKEVVDSSKGKIMEIKDTLRAMESDLYQCEKSLTDSKLELGITVDAEKKYKESEGKSKVLKKEVKVIKKNIEGLELLKDAFSATGIKAIIIDYIIPRLEDKVNDILKMLSDFTIRFDTQRKGVKEDIVKEGLFINIFNEKGEELDFENYSGGERIKIIVAISEALSELQNFGFRVLDEIFTALDEESTENFKEVIDALHIRFSQTLCITHLRNIKDLFDKKLIISKTDGTSVIDT